MKGAIEGTGILNKFTLKRKRKCGSDNNEEI